MTLEPAMMAERLLAALDAPGNGVGKRATRITHLQRLSGGANMETWSFDYEHADGNEPLILRRPPGGVAAKDDGVGELDLSAEAALIKLVGSKGVAVPRVRLVLALEHDLGEGYIMSREPGEALPGSILRSANLREARDVLAYQCGQALGHIHLVPVSSLPADIPDYSGDALFTRAQEMLDSYDNVSPVLQLGLNWLRSNARPSPRRTLVHGDFRNGNLLVDEQGLAAVLDWELAHIGDPVQDLGYISGNVWRFGAPGPVGGFGEYADLLAGYRDVTGLEPAMEDIRYWQVHTALSWGTVCLAMLAMYRSGQDRSLERAAIGRRLSEAEIDLLVLLEGKVL